MVTTQWICGQYGVNWEGCYGCSGMADKDAKKSGVVIEGEVFPIRKVKSTHSLTDGIKHLKVLCKALSLLLVSNHAFGF